MTRLLIRRLQTRLCDFARDGRGSLTVEAVVMFPMLFWAMLSMLVFFDAYRQSSLNVKAAFTIGDMISREVDPINAAYLDGAVRLFDELARTATPPRMRVTVIYYNAAQNKYYRDWSDQRGGVPVLTNADLVAMQNKLPVVPNNERLILVETWSDYSPPFNVGIDRQDLYNFVFTRPRFAPQVKFEA
ncbi:MAG: TadE/TadG family type IV pilus assembly protein [Paracoccaceae bacterium]